MPQAVSGGDLQEDLSGGVVLGVVREELVDLHAAAAIGGEGPLQEGGRGGAALVGEGLNVGVAAVVINGDVEVVDTQ
jgi:hypothetical protein